MGARLVAIGLAVGVGSYATHAHAQTTASPLAFAWDAPPGCPSASEVRARIDRAIASAPADPTALAIEARARVTRDAHGLTLSLATLRGAVHGERVMQGQVCEDLAGAAALIVALMVNPNARIPAASDRVEPPRSTPVPVQPLAVDLPRLVPAPATPGPVPRTELPRVAVVVPPARSRRTPARLRLVVRARFGLDALADVGTFASIAWGLAARGGVALGPVIVFASVAWWPTQHAVYAPNRNDGADVTSLEGALSACYALRFGPVEPALCAGFALGGLGATGTGVLHPASRVLLAATQIDHLAATVWLTRWLGVRLAAGIAVPIAPETFTFESLGPIFAQSPVAGRGSLGLDLSF